MQRSFYQIVKENIKRRGIFNSLSHVIYLGAHYIKNRLFIASIMNEKISAPILSKLLSKTWSFKSYQNNTSYVFIFLGEFGFELFNWQGIIRKFAKRLPDNSDIIIAGRKGLYLFYESASQYIDISDFEMYKNSVAAGYFAIPPDMTFRYMPPSQHELSFDNDLRKALCDYVSSRLNNAKKNVEFIFSSQLSSFHGCVFGVDRMYYGKMWHRYPGDIYAHFDLLTKNNVYKKISPDLNVKDEIEKKIGFRLNSPYILIQTRHRKIGPQFGGLIVEKPLIDELAQRLPVVLLSFSSRRFSDSESVFENIENRHVYRANSFIEQSCLIAHAYKCLFFTEGDLGSHTYLPPFMGKDVHIVASKDVFNKQSAPVSSWNRLIFHFGGQMIPIASESISESHSKLIKIADFIFS